MLRSVLLTLLFLSPAYSDTITVRQDGTGDHDSIQAAIDAAEDGDVISLGPGVWTGNESSSKPVVELLGKSVSIESTDGAESTFINGGTERPCLVAESATLGGGTIQLTGLTLSLIHI